MPKLWLIAREEYRRNVFTKTFILLVLALPLMLGLNIGIGIVMENMEDNPNPVGFVDRADVMVSSEVIRRSASEDLLNFIPFETEQDAEAALEADEIQAYYVLEPDYLETREATLIYAEEPGRNASQQFNRLVSTNFVSGSPPEVINRVARGSTVTIRSVDGMREFPGDAITLSLLLPLLVTIVFLTLILMSAGFLMEGVMKERENQTIEMVVTSTSPRTLVIGKVLGIIGVSLSQLAIWVLFGALLLLLGRDTAVAAWFHSPIDSWEGVLKVVAIGIPSYVLASALLFALGSILAGSQESQSIGGIIYLLSMLPFFFILAIAKEPNGTVAVLLSMLPFTALMAVAMRSVIMVVPLWQVAVSAILQALLAAGCIWIAVKAFNAGMLRFGQRLRLKDIIPMRETERLEP
jgi:ABC-2 type transport system permease protein